jgi:hypothetical protein
VLTNVVDRAVPFKDPEPAVKPDPFTVSINAPPPACADDGLIPLMAGPDAAVIVNVAPLEAVPAVLTVTVTVP